MSRTRLTIFMIVALVTVVSARLINHRSNHFTIDDIIPWGLIGLFIFIYLINELARVKREKRNQKQEFVNERRQLILDSVRKPTNKNSGTLNE